jgi:hypothetical protein
LQEGRENANIDVGLGFIWRISDKANSIGSGHASEDHAFLQALDRAKHVVHPLRENEINAKSRIFHRRGASIGWSNRQGPSMAGFGKFQPSKTVENPINATGYSGCLRATALVIDPHDPALLFESPFEKLEYNAKSRFLLPGMREIIDRPHNTLEIAIARKELVFLEFLIEEKDQFSVCDGSFERERRVLQHAP